MYAIVPAAGSGNRVGDVNGRSKLLLPLVGNKTVFELALQCLIDSGVLKGVVVATREQDYSQIGDLLHRICPRELDLQVVIGGDTRQDSVYRALTVLNGKTRFVMVHDAARPLCDPNLVRMVAEKAESTGAAILAVPSKCTLKVVEGGLISQTVSRSIIWEAQTPQVFAYNLLLEAYQQAAASNVSATDDSQLVERIGHQVSVLEGTDRNLKITTMCDFDYAASLLGAHRNGGLG